MQCTTSSALSSLTLARPVVCRCLFTSAPFLAFAIVLRAGIRTGCGERDKISLAPTAHIFTTLTLLRLKHLCAIQIRANNHTHREWEFESVTSVFFPLKSEEQWTAAKSVSHPFCIISTNHQHSKNVNRIANNRFAVHRNFRIR